MFDLTRRSRPPNPPKGRKQSETSEKRNQSRDTPPQQAQLVLDQGELTTGYIVSVDLP